MRKEYIPSTEHMELLRETGRKRLASPGLSDAVIGGLAYLYDTQVHDPSRYSGSYHDFLTSVEMANKPLPRLASWLRCFLGKYIIRERHIKGSWPGYIHKVAKPDKLHASPLMVVTDYNLFTTASTSYSLLLFDDRHLQEKSRFIGNMLDQADQAMLRFKKDEAYNFWLTRHYPGKNLTCPAPLNIPLFLVDFRIYLYKYTRLFGLKKFEGNDILFNWFRECYNEDKNPAGSTAIFNIPNDADNTSMAVAFQLLYQKWQGQYNQAITARPLETLQRYRDLNRTRGDRNNVQIGKDTGAFMTWLKDEELPTFSFPEKGIIPLSVNNVDIVINANILFALSLAHMQFTPGYHDAVRLLAQTIENYSWHDLSLYYPQKYIFPYAISRAWRDAGVREPLLDVSMSQLMVQILNEVTRAEIQSVRSSGAFPVNKYNNYQQSTALGLITLLNLGRKMAEKCGLSKEYDDVVNKAVNFLISSLKSDRARQNKTDQVFSGITPNYWESGILYSSSLQQLAHWRSHAQTTSLVLEALAKYILAYDLADDGLLSRRLYLEKHGQKWLLSLNPVD